MAYKVLLCMVFLLFGAVHVTAKPRSVQMPASCLGKTFCTTKPVDYPLKKFQLIMQDMLIRIVVDKKIVFRNDDKVTNEMDRICSIKSYNFRPIYQIVDTDRNVRYVAQIPDNFEQMHSVGECAHPGRVKYAGNVFELEQLDRFNVTCVETRVDHKFLVLSHDEKRVEVASVLGAVPVGCVCKYSYLH